MFELAAPTSAFRTLCLALCLGLAACGQPAAKANSGDTPDTGISLPDLLSGVDSSHPDGSSDSAAPDSATDISSPGDSGNPELQNDVADTGQGGCEFPAQPLPGEPGSVCKTSDECDSGACVDGPNGKICTSACSSCCPTGFKCEPFQTSGGDTLQVCLPKWNALCRPCDTDAECAKLGKDSLCVQYKATGSFCGGGCTENADCPSDYACQDAQGEKGAAKQCVRTSGVCSCSPQAIADGAQTTCKISNTAGTCTGVRKCALSGLNDCPAATPAPETCGNNVDDDCNGQTDENGAKGCTQLWPDGVGDGDGKLGSASQCQCAPSGLYTATTATDCDDANKAVNGKVVEVCDGIDNNCDGQTDEGCDKDGDGWCDINMAVVGDPLVCKKGKKDCDDTNAAINPGEQEICGNNIDDDCDGLTDSGPNVAGCVPFYGDNDGDGYGAGDPVCQCGAKGIYTATKTGDCADNDPKINPGAAELCGNQKDDDCDGLTDDANAVGCTNYYVDLDGDGFGTATPTCLCAPDATHSALKAGDCDDSSVAINPAATETCNGVDDNCNGTVDEMGAGGCTVFFVDGDGDGFGNPSTGLCLCQKTPFNTVSIGGDCNDDAATAHPGASEICDGLDNNCDGVTDEANAQGCTQFYADGDGDGWGDSSKSACLCAATGVFKVAKQGDCNDGDPAINPAAKELCDGVDNNCVNGIDEAGAQGCSVFWLDHDGDKFGSLTDSQCLCAPTGEYTATKSGDCNDNDKTVNPKASEICDGLDNDCDGVTDPQNSDGCTAWYVDKDGDNYGAINLASKCLCSALPGYCSQWGDCNDNDPTVNPGAIEVCNGKDDDCDGVKDPKNSPGCVNYYVDLDQDLYGANGLSQCQCASDGVFSATLSGDCNDSNAQINPGEAEICNGIDDNCNGQTDEGLLAMYYIDGDLDGYGVSGTGVTLCGPDGTHKVATGGDCDDTKASINPGAAETCNGIDDNCNGQTDEGLTTITYYADADLDGYGTGAGNLQCGPSASYPVTVAGDCNDSAKAINPGAAETCNGLDDNCNGQTDEGLVMGTYYQDLDNDGFGNTAVTVQACAKPAGYAVLSGDCNDLSANVYPGKTEICGDGLDNNCDGQTDEGCTVCQPQLLIDFENQDLTGWSLTAASPGTSPGWALWTPGIASTYSLAVSDLPNVKGYTPGQPLAVSATATKTLTVPAFAKAISVKVDYQAYVQTESIFSSSYKPMQKDTTASLTITIQGVSTTLNSSSTYGVSTVILPLATVPATTSQIPITFKFTQGTFSFLTSYQIDPNGYVAIDNIGTACP